MDLKNYDAVSALMAQRQRVVDHLAAVDGKDTNEVLSRVATRAGSTMVDNGVTFDEDMAKALVVAVVSELRRQQAGVETKLAELGVTGVGGK